MSDNNNKNSNIKCEVEGTEWAAGPLGLVSGEAASQDPLVPTSSSPAHHT